MSAERGADLDRGGADAAGAAMHQQPFTRLKPGPLEDVVPDREHGLGEGRGLGQRQSFRHRQRGGLGRGTELGVTAAANQRANEIARLEARGAGPQRDDLAGDFHAENIGGAFGRRVEALALEHVGAIDPGGRDLDQHLARTRLRHGTRARHQHFGSAGRCGLDRGHGLWQHRSHTLLVVMPAKAGIQ